MTAPGDIPRDGGVLPLVSEEATIVKRDVLRARTRIHVLTDTAEELLKAELKVEDVEISHIPINRCLEPGEKPPEQRSENGVLIIPLIEEVAVLEKRLLLREEIHIHHRSQLETVEMPVSLRKQRVEIERLNADGTATSTATENDP